MTDDYLSLIVTINCLGTLLNLNTNMQILTNSTDECLLKEILKQLSQINEKVKNGI